jgi:cell division protein FtsB
MLARRVLFAVSLFLNIVFVYNLIWGEKGIIAYKSLRERCAVLEATIEKIGEDNLGLSKEIRLLQSDEKYLEKVIRNRLNFVRENELLYIFPDEATAEPPGAPVHERKD